MNDKIDNLRQLLDQLAATLAEIPPVVGAYEAALVRAEVPAEARTLILRDFHSRLLDKMTGWGS